jgi:hypothetical protein
MTKKVCDRCRAEMYEWYIVQIKIFKHSKTYDDWSEIKMSKNEVLERIDKIYGEMFAEKMKYEKLFPEKLSLKKVDSIEDFKNKYYKEVLKRLTKLNQKEDIEWQHGEADDILIEVMKCIGLEEVANLWEKIPKWYA